MGRYSFRDVVEDGTEVFDNVPSTTYPATEDGKGGKTYRFKSPSAKVGMYLSNMGALTLTAASGGELDADDAKGLILDDGEEKDLRARVMGDTLQEMLDDGCDWATIQGIFRLLLRKHAFGEAIAPVASQGEAEAGETPAPANRAEKRAAAKKKAGSRSKKASGAATESAKETTSATSGSSTPQTTSPDQPEAQAV